MGLAILTTYSPRQVGISIYIFDVISPIKVNYLQTLSKLHKGLIRDTQHNNTAIMPSVAFY